MFIRTAFNCGKKIINQSMFQKQIRFCLSQAKPNIMHESIPKNEHQMEALFHHEEFNKDRIHVDTFKKALSHIKKQYA